ncbi:hypothetical protein GKA01_09650 [Gluconobacter kanchanaburiensis NBRC 103587]|uniref:Uncharacterized protein n=1 Tax=Gluconobacter kanchanaburiensis NBRC 103587 TaxID=1307948 RepID=A0A511B5V4_9PROT|nr:hypothetical protein AA103587_0698 [Gluconobacter kanchanaburiensis NBRC 103587]GEK95768.1 hypothetical protein GKA01_09650 [Gluconobacter kanchanaburiensis NBRC 103587]
MIGAELPEILSGARTPPAMGTTLQARGDLFSLQNKSGQRQALRLRGGGVGDGFPVAAKKAAERVGRTLHGNQKMA